jgi:uncharacterized membrane protein
MKRKFYGKAVRNGWIVAVIGILMIFAGFTLADIKGGMNYYALVMLGLFVVIVGVVIAVVYSGMEKSVKSAFNTQWPLLHFMASASDYQAFSAAEAEEIRSNNKISRNIGLFFCGLIAVGGPIFVRDTGYYFTIIAFGIAIFLIITQWIATGYYVNKLEKGDKEVILTTEGAYAGGQFHLWNIPLTSLDEVRYFNAGEYEGSDIALIRIVYSAITGTIVTPYTVIIPVPPAYEEQAVNAVRVLSASKK